MSLRLIKLLAAGPLALGCVLAAASVASAHVVQNFGPYTIAIGWQHEPAYAGELNAVQLTIKDAAGHPVDDLTGDDLHVQITAAGTTSSSLAFEPSFDPDTGLGNPGEYDAAVIPSLPGNYTFKLAANVHGTTIDQSFTSGTKTFDTVRDATAAEFPVMLPSTSEIEARITRDAQRIQTAQANAQSASEAAGRATVLGTIGIIAGVVLGGLALVLTWRMRRPVSVR
jgi:hypothetical protein